MPVRFRSRCPVALILRVGLLAACRGKTDVCVIVSCADTAGTIPGCGSDSHTLRLEPVGGRVVTICLMISNLHFAAWLCPRGVGEL